MMIGTGHVWHQYVSKTVVSIGTVEVIGLSADLTLMHH